MTSMGITLTTHQTTTTSRTEQEAADWTEDTSACTQSEVWGSAEVPTNPACYLSLICVSGDGYSSSGEPSG